MVGLTVQIILQYLQNKTQYAKSNKLKIAGFRRRPIFLHSAKYTLYVDEYEANNLLYY